MGGKRIRGLKARVGGCVALKKGGQMDRLSSGSVQAGGFRGGSHSAGRCEIFRESRNAVGRTAPGVRAAKSSESKKEEK